MAQLPVAGSLWLRSSSCVPLCCALPKLLKFISRDCPDKTTTLDFFQLLPICRSCSISTHSVRMEWHWDPGRSVCVGGWWEDREQPLLTHKQESLMGCDLRKQNPWGSDGISELNIGMKGYKPFFFGAVCSVGQEQMVQSPLWSCQLKTEETHQNGIRPHGPKLSVQLRTVN